MCVCVYNQVYTPHAIGQVTYTFRIFVRTPTNLDLPSFAFTVFGTLQGHVIIFTFQGSCHKIFHKVR